jgi:hypothetical protein
MEYEELENLPPEAYLDPKNFVSDYDHIEVKSKKHPNMTFAQEQYLKGLEYGKDFKIIHINPRSVWNAGAFNSEDKIPDHIEYNKSVLCSSEGIGYHRDTSEVLRGFLDSGAKIVVHRYTEQGIKATVIKPGYWETPALDIKSKPKFSIS